MNFSVQYKQLRARHRTGYILPEGLIVCGKINGLHPVLKRRTYKNRFNPLIPVGVVEIKWNKWNEPDEIVYKSLSGIKYVICDNNLLADIIEFMKQNGKKSTLPYLHIEGKDGWECYRRPAKSHILDFLKVNLSIYDIYSANGELVQEAYCKKREFTLCTDLD